MQRPLLRLFYFSVVALRIIKRAARCLNTGPKKKKIQNKSTNKNQLTHNVCGDIQWIGATLWLNIALKKKY